jgi:hypothetical protein
MASQQNTQTTIIPPEERLRLEAAERLGAMMVRSLGLLDDCSRHTAAGKSDAIGALNAAARLIKSNADITHALLRAAQGETRHRTIIEKAIGVSRGLNPNFSGAPSGETRSALEELSRRIARLTAFKEAEANGRPPPFEEYADDDDNA